MRVPPMASTTMSLAELQMEGPVREMDSAAESELAAQFPAQKFLEQLSPSQLELTQPQAIDPVAMFAVLLTVAAA
jgi:hypothetical protein